MDLLPGRKQREREVKPERFNWILRVKLAGAELVARSMASVGRRPELIGAGRGASLAGARAPPLPA